MSNRTSQFTEPIGRQVGARVQQPSCVLDLEAVNRYREIEQNYWFDIR